MSPGRSPTSASRRDVYLGGDNVKNDIMASGLTIGSSSRRFLKQENRKS